MAAEPTPSQTVGPYFSIGLLGGDDSELVPPGSPDAVRVAGRVLDGDGEPVNDAMVEVWQADEDGRYRPDFGWGRMERTRRGDSRSCSESRAAWTTARGLAGAACLRARLRARTAEARADRLYFPDEAANAEDRVLAAVPEAERAGLVARPVDGGLEFDVRLQGDEQTTFFAV